MSSCIILTSCIFGAASCLACLSCVQEEVNPCDFCHIFLCESEFRDYLYDDFCSLTKICCACCYPDDVNLKKK